MHDFKIRKAILPVAGLGTRFLPVTKVIPKELLPVLSKPLIQYAVEEILEAGIEEIIFIHSQGKEALESYFDPCPLLEERLLKQADGRFLPPQNLLKEGQYIFVRQQRLWGLGHAVLCAASWVGPEPFAVVLPDDIVMSEKGVLARMVEQYQSQQGNMVALDTVPASETVKYGIVDPMDGADLEASLVPIKSVVEKPSLGRAPSTLAVIGRYILHPDIFHALQKQEKGAGGEIQLTDALSAMIEAYGLTGYCIDGHRFDCGSVEGMIAAQVAFGLKDNAVKNKLRPLLEPWL